MISKSKPDLSDLARRVLEASRQHGLENLILQESLVVAVSGGPDSLALLHVLCELRGPSASASLTVAHLNHGFRGEDAEADARFVEQRAQQLGLHAVVGRCDVPALAVQAKLSQEEAARRARYAFLADVAAPVSATVATGHTADDQVETVIMHLLRGAGPTGLAGMAVLSEVPIQPINAPDDRKTVRVFRPFLEIWREEIALYCEQQGLQPRSDQSNVEVTYTRNRIRHELIPLLQRDYNPGIKEHVYNLSQIVASENKLLGKLVDAAWAECVIDEDNKIIRFDQANFANMPEALRRRIVRRGLSELAGTLDGFTFEHIQAVASTLSGSPDSKAALDLPHGLIAEHRGAHGVLRLRRGLQLDASRWPMAEPDLQEAISPNQRVDLSAGWSLISSLEGSPPNDPPGDFTALFDSTQIQHSGALVLRTWRDGDYIRPFGMLGKKKLHDVFVDAKIPREFRRLIPVVALPQPSAEVLWVPGPGGRRSNRALVGPETQSVLKLQFVRKHHDEGDK